MATSHGLTIVPRSGRMKNISRVWLILPLLFVGRPIWAQWLLPGQADFTQAITKVLPVRGNL